MNGRILVRKSDLARALGISSTTVYHWTKARLLVPAQKNIGVGGFLYDPEENRKRFEKIKVLKDQGKTLKQIKAILDKKG